jgi:hypothetical protein
MTQPATRLTHWYEPPPAATPDAPINVYAGPLEVGLGTSSFTVDGYVRLEWAPTPHVVWHVASDLNSFAHAAMEDAMAASDGPTAVQPPLQATVPPAPAVSWDSEAAETRSFRMSSFVGNPPVGSGTALRRVSFFVANNLTPLAGLPIEDDEFVWHGRLPLRGNGWEIDLDARRQNRQLREWLKEHGGYTVTHVGSLRRSDGTDFTPEQALDVLVLLQTVLSFAAGRHVAPLLPVGHDKAGSAVWSSWRMPLLDPWSGPQRFADLHYANHWIELFECFAAIWDDKFRGEEVAYRALRFYLDANHGTTMQLALSTAQAGLELLAYIHLVEDHALLSPKQYKDGIRSAHENFSDYLTQHLIDDAIDATATPALLSAAARAGCVTGPELLTRMRNGVIHPSRRKPKFTAAEWFEARQLALRYLILGILAYINYQGTYRDPLDPGKYEGTVAKMPWNP